jgi:hypothetical protein
MFLYEVFKLYVTHAAVIWRMKVCMRIVVLGRVQTLAFPLLFCLYYVRYEQNFC